jgi:hypothetical protein
MRDIKCDCREGFIDGPDWNGFDIDGYHIHPDYLKLALFAALEEHSCAYRLYSPVTGVRCKDGRVHAVEVTTKNGTDCYRADVVVDATGDGDIAFLAGAQMVSGREEDEKHMPITLAFTIANVDVERAMDFYRHNYQEFQDRVAKEAELRGIAVAERYWLNRSTVPSILSVNTSGAGLELDGTKSDELTIAEREGLVVAKNFVSVARHAQIPGLEDAYLLLAGSHVGVRETRRIVGEYVLTLEDAQAGARFPDVVARKYGVIDAIYIQSKKQDMTYDYPYRSLLPRRIDGLLVAGRCGSATHMGHAAGKSMGNMMEIGQAAGVAAAMCSREGVVPREVDVGRLQKTLTEMGVKLFD